MSACVSPIAEQALIDFWLEGIDADRIEEHLVTCETCTARMRALAPVMLGAHSMRASIPMPVLTRTELAALRGRGVRVAERDADPAGELAWTIDDSDVFVLVVPVDLRDVDTVDIDYCTPAGDVMTVFPDAPVTRGGSEILIACDRHIATAHAAIRFRVRALVGGHERVLADCRLRAIH